MKTNIKHILLSAFNSNSYDLKTAHVNKLPIEGYISVVSPEKFSNYVCKKAMGDMELANPHKKINKLLIIRRNNQMLLSTGK